MFDTIGMKNKNMTAKQKAAQKKRKQKHTLERGIPRIHNSEFQKHPTLNENNI